MIQKNEVTFGKAEPFTKVTSKNLKKLLPVRILF